MRYKLNLISSIIFVFISVYLGLSISFYFLAVYKVPELSISTQTFSIYTISDIENR